eukprot:scaffold57835_cov63-Phaeocystis_antarctica.AAC.1
MRPKRASALDTAAAICAGTPTSQRTNRHSQPHASISCAATWPRSAFRSHSTSAAAPAACALRAHASPRPCAAPVISTTLPASSAASSVRGGWRIECS